MRTGGLMCLGLSMLVVVACASKDASTATVGGASVGGAGGSGGEGGCPMDVPKPTFMVLIGEQGQVLPSDLQVRVKWSAGQEPAFILNEQATHGTLRDANFVCGVRPPAQLGTMPVDGPLECELWTPGTTQLEVKAEGFAPFSEDLAPAYLEGCAQMETRVVEVTLEPSAVEP